MKIYIKKTAEDAASVAYRFDSWQEAMRALSEPEDVQEAAAAGLLDILQRSPIGQLIVRFRR